MFPNNIHGQTRRPHDLIERLLILSTLENADGLTNIETINVSALLTDVARTYEGYAISNSVSIRVTFPAEVLTVHGDRFLLRQAVGNLVKNAIEHAHPNTEITVSAISNDQSLHITVTNIGETTNHD